MSIDSDIVTQSAYDKARFYADFNSLHGMKNKGQQSIQDLKRVAKEFESIYLNMMLKSMRKASEAFADGNYLSSRETQFYQEMLDNQFSMELSQGRSLGLADMLVRQLSSAMSIPVETKVKSTALDIKNSDVTPNTTAVSLYRQSLLGVVESRPSVETSVEKSSDPISFESPLDFVRVLLPHARSAALELKVDPEVLIAQAALETGWGQHIMKNADGSSSHNLFGIKRGSSWEGRVAEHKTLEYKDGDDQGYQEMAAFRSYGSYRDSFKDYVELLKSQSRYHTALASHDSIAFMRHLQSAGYATDPNYADKILSISRKIINEYTVYAYGQ